MKSNSTFYWNEQLEDLLNKSKTILLSQVTDGIKNFDTSKTTCLQINWSKEGIGYLLLQKHCKCPSDKAPTCRKEGWKLIYFGSHFIKGAENNYSPTEGESLAISWSLNHAKLFMLECETIIIATHHKLFLGIFSDQELNYINNPYICRLKEKTLNYSFTMQRNTGKWNRTADAFSRNPSNSDHIHSIFSITTKQNDQ